MQAGARPTSHAAAVPIIGGPFHQYVCGVESQKARLDVNCVVEQRNEVFFESSMVGLDGAALSDAPGPAFCVDLSGLREIRVAQTALLYVHSCSRKARSQCRC